MCYATTAIGCDDDEMTTDETITKTKKDNALIHDMKNQSVSVP